MIDDVIHNIWTILDLFENVASILYSLVERIELSFRIVQSFFLNVIFIPFCLVISPFDLIRCDLFLRLESNQHAISYYCHV